MLHKKRIAYCLKTNPNAVWGWLRDRDRDQQVAGLGLELGRNRDWDQWISESVGIRIGIVFQISIGIGISIGIRTFLNFSRTSAIHGPGYRVEAGKAVTRGVQVPQEEVFLGWGSNHHWVFGLDRVDQGRVPSLGWTVIIVTSVHLEKEEKVIFTFLQKNTYY